MSLSPHPSLLEYPHENPPAPGEWLQVADGIYWLRMPLPLALNHVHVWMLQDGNGWFVVDSGFGGKTTAALWDRIIETKLGGRPITRLLVTHFHPDHVGSAGYLWQRFQPEILMTPLEWQTARKLALDTEYTMRPTNELHYHAMGLSAEEILGLTGSGNRYAAAVTVPPETYTPLARGDVLTINGDKWQVLVGAGHSPAQVSLYCDARKIYISADQILPRISPNISVWANNPTEDALAYYLQVLKDTRALDKSALVLPSHNMPFYNLHARLDELEQHHKERLEQIVELCRARPHTVAEITKEAFTRPLDAVQTGFAISEMLAHANHLLGSNALRKEVDKNGVWRFSSI